MVAKSLNKRQPKADKPDEFVDLQGRPTKYKPEMDEQAFRLALLGLSQKEMAVYFDIQESTMTRWVASFDTFRAAIRAGGDEADMNVVSSLYKQATGFEVEVEELKVINTDRFTQQVVREKVTRYVAPDYRATGRWLGNRRRAKWDDKGGAESGNDPQAAAKAAQAAIKAADDTTDSGADE